MAIKSETEHAANVKKAKEKDICVTKKCVTASGHGTYL
jgi:hypothetical protein